MEKLAWSATRSSVCSAAFFRFRHLQIDSSHPHLSPPPFPHPFLSNSFLLSTHSIPDISSLASAFDGLPADLSVFLLRCVSSARSWEPHRPHQGGLHTHHLQGNVHQWEMPQQLPAGQHHHPDQRKWPRCRHFDSTELSSGWVVPIGGFLLKRTKLQAAGRSIALFRMRSSNTYHGESNGQLRVWHGTDFAINHWWTVPSLPNVN